MTRNNNNRALDRNAIVEEEKQLNWEDDIIDIKKDTDGASLTELTIMISNEIIPKTKDKYFENQVKAEISAISLQNKSDPSVLIESEESIMNRKIGEHMTLDEKLMIYQLIRKGYTIKRISAEYQISESSIRRIIRILNHPNGINKLQAKTKTRKLLRSEAVKSDIQKYLAKTTTPITIREIQSHTLDQLGVLVPRHQITSYIKSSLRLSYKKGSSRPVNVDLRRVDLCRHLFSIRLVSKLRRVKVLVNVDEASINKETKMNYSWLPTGVSSRISNVGYSQFVNIIGSITSKGLALWQISTSKTNSEEFIRFLEVLIKTLNECDGWKTEEIGVILDNWSIHRSRNVLSFWKNQQLKLFFIPQYCPEMAPIEVFFAMLKKKLSLKIQRKLVRAGKEEGFKMIKETIQSIEMHLISSLWRKFIENIRESINEVNRLIGE